MGETDLGTTSAQSEEEGPGSSGTSGGVDESGEESTDDGPQEPPPPTSSKANVKQKGPKQLRNDFARALSLPPDELCFELDGLSCTDEVHTVTLGGVEPDELGIYERAETSSATTPIAVERVALSACGRRVDADFAGEDVIFDLSLSGAELSDVDEPAVTNALTDLYRGALLRDPTPEELQHLRDLYPDVVATGVADPARSWAVGACFAVLTTMESIFY